MKVKKSSDRQGKNSSRSLRNGQAKRSGKQIKNSELRLAGKQRKNSVRTVSSKRRADYIKLYKWKPGQSGNPKGRPKKDPLTAAYKEILEAQIPDDPYGRTFAQALAQVMLQAALLGNVRAAREITDRVEGKAKQTVELTTPPDRPLQLEIVSALDKVYGSSREVPGSEEKCQQAV